ncbi:LEM domain-containing protein 1 [Synchiropus splendidus]|uniref:LEM domain-containing protein 1 n=1 Tax=Synchiropus splendidus TaxID=270530 RepID=UPI00237E38E2|nr:LEM domain-containing protein 1 [Synchiropus splendidus]
MPAFVDDPSQLSISQLKSDLIAHNVALPPSKSRKQVYVELHLKHVEQRKAQFSSDEEEQQQQSGPEDGETIVDPSVLTDDDLKAALLAHGVTPGPIVASTRSVYENKLRKLLQPVETQRVNGVVESEWCFDSEEEEEEEELDDDQELGSRGSTQTEVEEQEPSSPLTHLVPDLQTTPSGIYATRRRPIRGASQRPVLYDYPDAPLSPVTRARLEVERQVVPTHVLLLVFSLLTCLLYFIYTCVEDCSVTELFSDYAGHKTRALLPSEVQETPLGLA